MHLMGRFAARDVPGQPLARRAIVPEDLMRADDQPRPAVRGDEPARAAGVRGVHVVAFMTDHDSVGHWIGTAIEFMARHGMRDGVRRPPRVRGGDPRYPGGVAEARSFGRYRVTATIGTGAMGEVFAAVDEALGREVAVKTLRGH